MNEVRIGIVIPTSDRCIQLYSCVETLSNKLGTNRHVFDLCVVDDGKIHQIDESRVINIWPSARVYKSNKKGSAHAKNIGVGNVIGEWIAFIDDDCSIDNDWGKSLLNTIENVSSDCVAVGGDVLSSVPDSLISWYLKTTDHLRGPLTNNGRVVGVAGANMIIRRSAFSSVNGFEERLTKYTVSANKPGVVYEGPRAM